MRSKPLISVIIPVYNDIEGIVRTLNSLLKQTYPKELYEIIVVDNNSSDDTPKIIQRYMEKYPSFIIGLSENEIQSSYAARNKAITHSKGDVLAFIDSDMWVEKKWLTNIAEIFNDKKPKYVGFNVKNIITRRTIPSVYDKITGFPIEFYMKKYKFAGAGCIAVSRKIFDEIGMFNHRMISAGDDEFGNRVFKKGYTFIYKKDIKMYHPARDSLVSLIKKWYRIGRGSFQLDRIHSVKRSKFKNFLLNPIYFFLPPSKWERNTIRKSRESSFIKIVFFLMGWLKNIIFRLGYIYEKLNYMKLK